ncbi:MAG: hypothetical protein LBT47_06210 [Deltaproteobacteria bacterium]|jgi:two-component system phosphate regulon sensor histidine kinase PhoR|nr:hypothetical protein [Deltaproteobacteria bacterium]
MTSKNKIFIMIFLPAALLLIAGLAVIEQKNRTLSRVQFENQLKNQWLLVSEIQRSSLDTEDFRRISQTLGLRVTLIAGGGQVLFDTGGDTDAMEDHSQREEIRNAFLGFPMTVVRQSRTTGVHSIYYARMVAPDMVLRVAYAVDYFQAMEKSLLTQAFSGLVALVIVVAVFAMLISRQTGQTIRALTEAVNEAKNGKIDLPTFNSEALDGALYALSTTTRELKDAASENSRLSTRLGYILEHILEGVILIQDDEIIYHNDRAARILNFKLPKRLSEINQAAMISVLSKMTSDNPETEFQLGGRIIRAGYNHDGPARLIVLHDVSDREKYLGFKTDLIANISHELKTPLTLIMATSELIVKDNKMPEDILLKFLNSIFNNCKRLNIILDDLISLHRLENFEGGQPAEASLDEVLADVKELLNFKDKKVTWNCDQGVVRIHSSHILSVVTNLLTNAVKYSTGSEIEVGVRKKDNVLEISVSDGGPVIELAERERIFERFYSLSQSRTRERSGSGLGLSIVKHIARLYGGQALVTENEHGGNTFIVRLLQR